MKPSVYLETMISSYLTARRSRDLVIAVAHDFRTAAGAGIMVPEGGPNDGRTREAYAAQFQGDIRAMMNDIRRRQKESGRSTVAREPKRIPIPQGSAPTHE